MALWETERRVRRFGALTAVKGLTFSVEAGEVLGWLGPNGAGKTTVISGSRYRLCTRLAIRHRGAAAAIRPAVFATFSMGSGLSP